MARHGGCRESQFLDSRTEVLPLTTRRKAEVAILSLERLPLAAPRMHITRRNLRAGESLFQKPGIPAAPADAWARPIIGMLLPARTCRGLGWTGEIGRAALSLISARAWLMRRHGRIDG